MVVSLPSAAGRVERCGRNVVDARREDLFEKYQLAVRAFREAIHRSKGLAGGDFYKAMREADRLYREAARLESALAEYDKAMR